MDVKAFTNILNSEGLTAAKSIGQKTNKTIAM